MSNPLRISGIAHAQLDPVELQVDPDAPVFLSGPSGSGKSLLLRAIADLDPNPGEVWLGSQARSALSAPEWRRRVGLLPAESAWWDDRVGAHFPESAASMQCIDWLQRLGFEPSVMDWSVARLSSGERQRLALARLLAQRPQALLLDEATANLDPHNRQQVESLILDYCREAAAPLLWVSHDPDQRQRLGVRRLIIHKRRLEPES